MSQNVATVTALIPITHETKVANQNLRTLWESKLGSKFYEDSKTGLIKRVEGIVAHIWYFFVQWREQRKVKSAINTILSNIQPEKIAKESDRRKVLSELFFRKLASLSHHVFDRSHIGSDSNLEKALIDCMRDKLKPSQLKKFSSESKSHRMRQGEQKETKEKVAAHADIPLSNTEKEFITRVNRVKLAIRLGIELRTLSFWEGTSGCYPGKGLDLRSKNLIMFKAGDEGPFGPNVPKRLQRIKNTIQKFFGINRHSLRDNQTHLAEHWAYIVSEHLGLDIVPYTALVEFTSTAFYQGGLQTKVGSCQIWLDKLQMLDRYLKVQTPEAQAASKQRLSSELKKYTFCTFLIGNQDTMPNNCGLAPPQIGLAHSEDEEKGKSSSKSSLKAVSFDDGLAFPWRHPRGALSTRKANGWASLFSAKDTFDAPGDTFEAKNTALGFFATKADLYQKLRQAQTEEQGVFEKNQELTMTENAAVLLYFAVKQQPLTELAKIKTQAQFATFFREHPDYDPFKASFQNTLAKAASNSEKEQVTKFSSFA